MQNYNVLDYSLAPYDSNLIALALILKEGGAMVTIMDNGSDTFTADQLDVPCCSQGLNKTAVIATVMALQPEINLSYAMEGFNI